MSQVLFIADTHFGHKGISDKFRKEFSSDREHDETIHENILSSSGKRNQLWLLGDIAFKPEQFYKIAEYADNFESVNIVLGNHDHKDLAHVASCWGVRVYGLTKKYKAWISHCPIHKQEMYRAVFNIHGHLHSKTVKLPWGEDSTLIDDEPDDSKYFCVSCEQTDYKPMSLQTIREKIRERGLQV